MFSPESFNSLFREVLARLNGLDECKDICNNEGCINTNGQSSEGTKSTKACSGNNIAIDATQALVIAGILGGVLQVRSILFDKDQIVQILLEGSLKQKTELEKMLDQIGTMPFDEVMRALLERLT